MSAPSRPAILLTPIAWRSCGTAFEYSFLPGARLWASPDFARVASACQNDSIVTEKPSEPRRAFILLGLIEEGEKGGRVSSVLVGISAMRSLAGSRAKLDCGGTVNGYRGSLKLELKNGKSTARLRINRALGQFADLEGQPAFGAERHGGVNFRRLRAHIIRREFAQELHQRERVLDLGQRATDAGSFARSKRQV